MAKVETITWFKDKPQKLHSTIFVLFFFFFQKRSYGYVKFKEKGNILHSLIGDQQYYTAKVCRVGDNVAVIFVKVIYHCPLPITIHIPLT